MGKKPKELPHLRLRVPASLLARLEKSREKEGRTLTGEIVHRLEQSFRRDDLEDVQTRVATQIVDVMLDIAEGKSREEVLAKAGRHASELVKRVGSEEGGS